MASNSSNNVNALDLPQITAVVGGDFLPVFTTNGTKIIDYANLNFLQPTDTGGLTLTDGLTGTDINISGNLIVGGNDYTNLTTTIASNSAYLYTLINNTSASEQSSNVQLISSSQIIDESNIAILSANQLSLSANLISLSAIAIAKTRVYSQTAQTAGNNTTAVTVTFTNVPTTFSYVYASNINFVVYDTAAANIYTPVITTSDVLGRLYPTAGTLNVSVVVNTLKSFSATLTLFY